MLPFQRVPRLLPAGVLLLAAAVEVGWSAPPQAPAIVQGSASVEALASSQPNPTGQSSQSAPQNPSPPPGTNAPGQRPASEQNPPPSAQLPEPAIKNPDAQPAPKPAVEPPTLTIPRLSRAPVLEDFLTMKPEGDPAQKMARVTEFMQRNPHDGEKVSEETEAYLGYDEKNLYVVFVCFDDPKKVRARMSRREDIYDDDQVAVMFDTFHDRRRAYEFQTTPLGVQWDAIYTEAIHQSSGGNWDTSWDAVWDSKGKVTDRGWVAWMAIPFKSLRFPSTEKQEWGILMYRGITRKNEDSYWPQVTYRIAGRLGQEATLHGLEGISPGRDIELIPYGIMRGFRSLDTTDPYNPFFQNATAQGQIGLDAKFVIKDHFVLDLTANPDFSQVETEDPQITVNQRFEVYFPEKRPFFLENADYFRTPIDLFFTRNIQDPSAGIRLTGKEGPYSVGLMASDDRAPGLAVPSFCPPTSTICSDALYGDRSYFTIARASRDIFKESTIGAVFTNWECPSTGEYNRVGGLDTRLRFNANWILEGQAVTSSSNLQGLNVYLSPAANLENTCEYNLFPFNAGNLIRAGNGNHYAGPADKVELRRNGLHFNYIGTYQDVSPGFVTVPGFVNRVDIRQLDNTVVYRFRPKKGWVLAWGPSMIQHYTYDHEGNRLDTYYDPYLRIEGRGQTNIYLDPYVELRERLRPQDFTFIGLPGITHNQDYHEHSSSARIQTSYFKRVTLLGIYSWGNGVNFSPTANVLPQSLLSRLNMATVFVSVRPLKPLKIENTYLFSRLRAADSTYLQALALTPGIGKGIFNNHIVQSKWNWQFTPQLSLRLIMQYNSLLANTPGNTVYPYTYLPTQKQFNADLLLTYLIHPGTAIYLGYNSDLENLNVEPSVSVFNTPKGYLNDSRQFFVKVSYQFRF
ncbi:MAG: DUF5916 domain-containing protein [Candidatus Sulfotelmatobacter sp.]